MFYVLVYITKMIEVNDSHHETKPSSHFTSIEPLIEINAAV